MKHRAVLALGANLGDPHAALQGAVNSLVAHPRIDVERRSPIVETDPVGGPDQPVYLNAVVIVRTDLSPDELLAVTQGIEADWHRTREVRWGPRTLDIDLIAFDDLVQDDAHLTLPHPRAWERGFVIVPWRLADPAAVLPGVGPIADLAVDTAGVRATDLAWSLP